MNDTVHHDAHGTSGQAKANHKQDEHENRLFSEALHLAHYAHQTHLTAEGLEFAAHATHHAITHVEHAKAAQKLLLAHSQMAYDLRRMKVIAAQFIKIAREGGARGLKAKAGLPEIQRAIKIAESEFERERAAVRKANELLKEFKWSQRGVRGAATSRIGQSAIELEVALSKSAIGKTLMKVGKITTSKTFVRGLVVVGAVAEGVASYADSTAKTTTGKAANAALGAGAGALTMANPVVAAADLVAPKGYKLSEVYHGGANAVTAIGEGLLTKDTQAMDDFHRRSMQGHYGKVMQASSEAGEYWAEHGISGGLKEFADSVRWWLSND